MRGDVELGNFSTVQQLVQKQAQARRREEIARDLLLKLVESTPGALKYDTKFQVAKALEYTDELLAQLDKGEAPCDKTK